MRPLKWYHSLTSGRVRREEGYFLIEGLRAVMQVLATSPGAVEELLLTDELAKLPQFVAFPQRNLTTPQLAAIAASVHPQGVVALVRIPPGSYRDELPTVTGNRIVLLDDVQDPGNVGTLIRCAAAFDCSGLILSPQCADPFGPKSVQASAGALLVPWIRRCEGYVDMVGRLKSKGYRLLCADVAGRGGISFAGEKPCIIALGNEGTGLTGPITALADERFLIPMNSRAVESLNVGVSGAIALFAAYTGQEWK